MFITILFCGSGVFDACGEIGSSSTVVCHNIAGFAVVVGLHSVSACYIFYCQDASPELLVHVGCKLTYTMPHCGCLLHYLAGL